MPPQTTIQHVCQDRRWPLLSNARRNKFLLLTKVPIEIYRKNIDIAIIAVPPEEAQKVANTLVNAGIKVIMNYTSIPIKVPKKVKIETTDPIEKLLHTLYYLSHTGYAELNSFKHK